MHEKVIPTISDRHGESLIATTVRQEVNLVVAILVIVRFDSYSKHWSRIIKISRSYQILRKHLI